MMRAGVLHMVVPVGTSLYQAVALAGLGSFKRIHTQLLGALLGWCWELTSAEAEVSVAWCSRSAALQSSPIGLHPA